MSDTHEDLKLYTSLFVAQKAYLPIWQKNENIYNAKFDKKVYAKLKKKRRSKTFIPVVRNTINIISSIFSTAFFSEGSPIEILGDDEEKVKDLNVLSDYYFRKLKPNKVLKKAMKSALLFKMGIVATYWNKHKNRVETKFIPITDIAFDNECSDIDDQEAIAYRKQESVRLIKQKIKDKIYNKKNLLKKLKLEDQINKRLEVKIIYKQTSKGYIERTFIKDILVREINFKKLPFQFGYALDEITSTFPDTRKKQIAAYGGDLVTLLKELQKELNQKRNLKNDIQEKTLNPDVFVGDGSELDPKDLTYGHGKAIRFKGKLSEVRDRTVPNDHSINEDILFIQGDLRDASSVNPIQEGRTGASDRRSAKAMSVINSNSSMRIEEMISLITETLFEHWAKAWFKLVLENADDELINKLTKKETHTLGVKGKRDSLEYEIKINFGISIEKEAKITDILNAIQMLSQNQNINTEFIERLLKKFIYLRFGDETDLKDLFTKELKEEEKKTFKADEV